MNAKNSDIGSVQEIYDVITQTKQQMERLAITKEQFLNPQTDEEDLITEGILNRVLRVTEEAGHVSDKVAKKYGFEKHQVLGVRNRLAHAYGDVDREIIWNVIVDDFDDLLKACHSYCDEHGFELE